MTGRRKARPRVNMATKTQPVQDRSRTTFEAILKAAGELLEEVGIERFSTNLVCKRAGLTPPALYRYFPNKYALLRELGARLMAAQDEVLLKTLEKNGLGAAAPAQILARSIARQKEINRVTAAFPGGLWIMRALRAVPMLHEVRLASVTFAANRLFDDMRGRFPELSDARLRAATRLTVEISYAATEMVVEAGGERDGITEELCAMLAQYYSHLGEPIGE